MLHPCTRCHRHVAVADVSCPFCGAQLAARPATALAPGRWSRAAVFAGAALSGCYTGNPPQQHPQAPTPEQHQQTVAPPDAGPESTTTFAKPPTTQTELRGTIVDRLGAPVASAIIQAQGPETKLARSDNQGRFVFRNLAPGSYRLIIKQPVAAPMIGSNRMIQLTRGVPQQVNLAVDLQPRFDPDRDRDRDHDIQNHPCDNGVCAPYGAPPARRRIV